MPEDLAITDREFELFRTLISRETGILLTEHKRPLLWSRLAKRLRRLGLASFSEYYEYLRTRDRSGEERRELINCITTNKTEFFRESHHFDFLRKRVLEPLARNAAAGGERKLRIWSAACSTGEEPYSIAMTVAEVLPLAAWDVRILASDIDTRVLEQAARGRYAREVAAQLAPQRRRRWCHGVSPEELEIDPALRELVTFRQINFVREPWPIRTRFDVIFCRNVMIYFSRETQERIYTRFHELLRPGGFLVAGHSENLLFMAHAFEAVGQTIYKRRSSGQSRRSLRPPVHVRASRPPPGVEQPVVRTAPGRPAARRSSSAQRAAPQARSARGSDSRRPGRVSLVPGSRSKRAASVASAKRPSVRIAPEAAALEAPSKPSRAATLPRVRIMSGELFASDSPTLVSTLLGSCVAACVFDRGRGIGGMNHFMLPSGDGGGGYSAICFGTNAMELLINELLRLGARRDQLEARVFGAAHVIVGTELSGKVPAENARFIREFLANEHIPISEESLGGTRPLMVSFETHTGRARARVAGDAAEEVARAEATFKARLDRELQPNPENVTLF
jgi:chemotaxis protein methyltransferase CheR